MAVKTIQNLEKKSSLTGNEFVPVFDSEGNAGKATVRDIVSQVGTVSENTINTISTARLIPSIVGYVPEFVSGTYYSRGEFVIHDGRLYQALLDHKTGAVWDSTSWEETSILSQTQVISEILGIQPYNPEVTYSIGDKFIYQHQIGKAIDIINPKDKLIEGVNFKFTSVIQEQADNEFVKTTASMSDNLIWQDTHGNIRYTSGKLQNQTFKDNTELVTLLACSVTGTTLKDCFNNTPALKGGKCYILSDNVTDLSGMFQNGGNPGELLKYLDTTHVNTMENMFNNSSAKYITMCTIPVGFDGAGCNTTNMFNAQQLVDIEFPAQSLIQLKSSTEAFYVSGAIFSSVNFSNIPNLSRESVRNIINALGQFNKLENNYYLVNQTDGNNIVNMTFIPTLTLSEDQKSKADEIYSKVYGIGVSKVRSYWTQLITDKNWILV